MKRRFFFETRQQKRSLAALNEYFANEVSEKKIASKLKQGFLEVPYRVFDTEYNHMPTYVMCQVFIWQIITFMP